MAHSFVWQEGHKRRVLSMKQDVRQLLFTWGVWRAVDQETENGGTRTPTLVTYFCQLSPLTKGSMSSPRQYNLLVKKCTRHEPLGDRGKMLLFEMSSTRSCSESYFPDW